MPRTTAKQDMKRGSVRYDCSSCGYVSSAWVWNVRIIYGSKSYKQASVWYEIFAIRCIGGMKIDLSMENISIIFHTLWRCLNSIVSVQYLKLADEIRLREEPGGLWVRSELLFCEYIHTQYSPMPTLAWPSGEIKCFASPISESWPVVKRKVSKLNTIYHNTHAACGSQPQLPSAHRRAAGSCRRS